MTSSKAQQALQRRFDAVAIDQLRAELVRLAEANERLAGENESLRDELHWAEQCAEMWQNDALSMQEQLCDATHSMPGITMSGALVVVPQGGAHV